MWVLIKRIDDSAVYGTVENEPHDMPLIELGMPVTIPLTHVISTDFHKDHIRPEVAARREYLDRCFVDVCVIEGRSHVDYVYREPPDMTRDGDTYPDSGWRMRGTDREIEADAERDDPFSLHLSGQVT